MNTTDFSQFGPNAGLLRELYELYQQDPALVDTEWQAFFSELGTLHTNGHSVSGLNGFQASPAMNKPQENVLDSFRRYGHWLAKINPLTVVAEPEKPRDLPEVLSQRADSDLAATYCGSIGFDFMHLTSLKEREWLTSRIEREFPAKIQPTAEVKKRMLTKLIAGEMFESELHKKYVGAKRFSLEGGETLIAMLDELLLAAPQLGIAEVVFGMAHRGRLNILTNILGKPLEKIFQEFEDLSMASVLGSGDVKYHLGYSGKVSTSPEVKVQMVPNPSHLEFVNCVVEGICRAIQDLGDTAKRSSVLPLVIHGDAAFAGQGIVFETINYSRLPGYETGGTLHIIINNQIGFTTTPDEGRSSGYCTDMAKGVDSPVFHVNAEDVNACAWVTKLATEFRQEFKKDVFVDLYCYRKYGHNEGDDPSFTQPLTYAEIKNKKPVYQTYADSLMKEGILSQDELAGLVSAYKSKFVDAQSRVKPAAEEEISKNFGKLRIASIDTSVSKEKLRKVAKTLIAYPQDFEPHPKLFKILEKRVETVESGTGIEWGTAEALAYGSLLLDGYSVRLSGQDCGRGTFSQRHLMLDHYTKRGSYAPLTSLSGEQDAGKFEVLNSSLSENAVLGFEFGYSSIAEKTLVLWEGQFGDFVNGAQVIIDQFISSSEVKWSQFSGVTLLLPHGYEGQGPEHSSARFERFLQLSAEGNMTVCYPSTAAQYFHMLRRQAMDPMRRPLIVMTPKSLLRLPSAMSNIDDFATGEFQTAIVEDFGAKGKAEIVVLLTGKIYHEVKAEIEKRAKKPFRVIRLEQLHPFPQFDFKKMLGEGRTPKKVFWVQEEPENMGAWNYLQAYLEHKLGLDVTYVGRPASASTATGSPRRHVSEQRAIIDGLLKELE